MKYRNGKFQFILYQVKIDVFDALYYVTMPNLIFFGVAIRNWKKYGTNYILRNKVKASLTTAMGW